MYLKNNPFAKILFNFVTHNSNVEFSLLQFSNHAYLSTSFSIDSESGGTDLLKSTLDEGYYNTFSWTHNHPNGTLHPSGFPGYYSKYGKNFGDKAVVEYFKKHYPNARISYFIWANKQTIQYNEKGIIKN